MPLSEYSVPRLVLMKLERPLSPRLSKAGRYHLYESPVDLTSQRTCLVDAYIFNLQKKKLPNPTICTSARHDRLETIINSNRPCHRPLALKALIKHFYGLTVIPDKPKQACNTLHKPESFHCFLICQTAYGNRP